MSHEGIRIAPKTRGPRERRGPPAATHRRHSREGPRPDHRGQGHGDRLGRRPPQLLELSRGCARPAPAPPASNCARPRAASSASPNPSPPTPCQSTPRRPSPPAPTPLAATPSNSTGKTATPAASTPGSICAASASVPNAPSQPKRPPARRTRAALSYLSSRSPPREPHQTARKTVLLQGDGLFSHHPNPSLRAGLFRESSVFHPLCPKSMYFSSVFHRTDR